MAHSMTKAVTQGMKMLGGSNVSNYTLQFLDHTKNFQAGQYETIVVPQIMLGRDPSCVVQYGDDFSTVSRKHAAIERDGQDILIKQMSQTNPTLINGQPIKNQWYLKNGDEIQLSAEGPRLRFNTTPTKTSGLKFTARMQLFARQALKPYKYAVAALGVLLLLVFSAGAYAVVEAVDRMDQQQVVINKQKDKLDTLSANNQALADSMIAMNQENLELRGLVQNMNSTVSGLQSRLAQAQRDADRRHQELLARSTQQLGAGSDQLPQIIDGIENSVLYMTLHQIDVTIPGAAPQSIQLDGSCHCSGFLLNDGRFVTARHCTELDAFDRSELTAIASSGGKVVYHMQATSPDKQINLSFTSEDFTYDKTGDIIVPDTINGIPLMLRQAKMYDGKDWAVLRTNQRGNIRFDNSLSRNLQKGSTLHCLGYTYGSQYQNLQGIDALYSTAKVARDGIYNACIMVSETGFDNGNSGGPLFYIDNGQATVVGLVSASYFNTKTGRDDAVGSVIPIANVP